MKPKRKSTKCKIYLAILVAIFTKKVHGELLIVTQPTSLHCVSTDDNPGALQWILPTGGNTETTITKQTSEWKLQQQKDQFYCNFSQDCSGLRHDNVKSNTEIETPELSFGPVTDARWNSFLIKNAKDYQKLPVRDRSILHMSVLAEDDGFIILSKTKDSTSSGSYYFVLDGWSKRRSVLRKCDKGVHEKGYDDATRLCSQLKQINNTQVLADGKQWIHFTIEITRTRNYYKTLQTIDIKLKVNGQVYLESTDRVNPIDIEYVSFRRYENPPAFWKYHEYKVFKQDQNIIEIPIKITSDGKICVSMTYFSSKEVTVDILSSSSSLATKNLKPTVATWQVERIEASISQKEQNYKLQITKDRGTTFYLGEVRSCSSSDFYVTSLEANVKKREQNQPIDSIECQSSNMKLQSNGRYQIDNNCKAGNFGPRCELSCNKIVGAKCSGGKVCIDTRGCFCLPGYQLPLYNCGKECDDGKYGQNCRETCVQCALRSCNKQTGECTSGCASKKHKTPFCTEQYLVFERSQFEIKALEDGPVKFEVTPSQINFLNGKQNVKLLFQIKESKENTWENSSTFVDWSPKQPVLIPGLRANTQYEIRPVLLDVDGQGYFGDDVPSVTVTTKCQIIDVNEIKITSANLTTLQVDWNNDYDLSCSLQDYTIQVNGETKEQLQYLPFFVFNLENGSKNKVIIYKNDKEIKEEEVKLIEKKEEDNYINWETEIVIIVISIVVLLMIIASIVGYCCWKKYLKNNTYKDNKNISEMRANRHNGEGSGFIPLPEREQRLGYLGCCLPVQLRTRIQKYLLRFNSPSPASPHRINPAIRAPNNQAPPIPLSNPTNSLRRHPLNINVNGPNYPPRTNAQPGRNHLLIDFPSNNAPSVPTSNPPPRPQSSLQNLTPQMMRSGLAINRPSSVFLGNSASINSAIISDPDVPPPIAPRFGVNENYSYPINISQLESYVVTSLANGELRKQHSLFPRGQTQSWDYGRLPENKMKNRYGNLVAYDLTRVKLPLLPGDTHSDYINANYIDGYKVLKQYIATQGPKEQTMNDFWRMVWQDNVNVIVMLANVVENGKTKCDKYWPDLAQSQTYGAITIQTMSEEVFADYTYRSFNITCNGVKRKAVHLHFTSWPDHGVPIYPQYVSTFIKKMRSIRTTGPILVHCSAGVGRTGTILLADACLRMAAAEQRVDPLAMLQKMRAQRPNLVDNAEQYELVHLVLLESLSESDTFSCSKFISELDNISKTRGEEFNRRFNKLHQICTRDTLKIVIQGEPTWPRDKSRSPDIAPGNYGRVILNRPLGGSDYINAVYVDGFRTKGQFIASQLPLTNTVQDFWHLVMQTDASLIVILNTPPPDEHFWPEIQTKLHLNDSSYVILNQVNQTKFCVKLFLKINKQANFGGRNTLQDVEMLMLKNWYPHEETPSSADELLDLWQETQHHYRGNGPIVVLCHDGARGCGLFLSSVFVVEKMKLEKEVDVGLAVRTSRLTRPYFIDSLTQFKFLHEVARTYLEKYETYANFQEL